MSISNIATHSFVILIEYEETVQDDILIPLGLSINYDESDIALGYYSVFGTEENIKELKDYLSGKTFL